MVPAVASFVLPLLAPVPQPDLETCAALALLVATQCPRVLSIGDRPVVGNHRPIQILGSLEAACDDGAIAAVGQMNLRLNGECLRERSIVGVGIPREAH